jgi:hypothetical protein
MQNEKVHKNIFFVCFFLMYNYILYQIKSNYHNQLVTEREYVIQVQKRPKYITDVNFYRY